jgi:hypothetical protein
MHEFYSLQSRMTLPRSPGIITAEEYRAIAFQLFLSCRLTPIEGWNELSLRCRPEANPEYVPRSLLSGCVNDFGSQRIRQ